MKKALVIVLCVLMLISLSSCNQDKSSETVSTFNKFASAYVICRGICDACDTGLKYVYDTAETKDLSQADNFSKAGIETYLEEKLGQDDDKLQDIYIQNESDVTRTGTVTGTNYEYEIKNASIASTYRKTYGDSTGKTTYSDTLTVSGTYSLKVTKDPSGEDKWQDETYSINLSVNGEQYNLSYTIHEENNSTEYTDASINGAKVSLKLLNSKAVTWCR